jgi:hypothetical protein
MAKKMGRKGPSSRKGDPNWVPKPARGGPSYKQSVILEAQKEANNRAGSYKTHRFPSTDKALRAVAAELIEYAFNNPYATDLYGYCFEKRYYPAHLYAAAKQHDELGAALIFAEQILIHHLTKDVRHNKIRIDLLNKLHRIYDPIFNERYSERIAQDIKAKIDAVAASNPLSGIITYETPYYATPNSPGDEKKVGQIQADAPPADDPSSVGPGGEEHTVD